MLYPNIELNFQLTASFSCRKFIQMPSPDPQIPRYTRICKQCGTLNNNGDALPGSGWIELVLWLCYIVPGIVYSIWRRTKRNAACVACSSRELIQVGTPVGAQLVQRYHPESAISTSGPIHAPDVERAPPPSGARILKALGLVLVAVFVLAFIAGQIARLS